MLASVRVYLCRHAEAAPGDPDELRELTPVGREQARGLGERLAGLVEPPVLVLTSPLVRARQTAQAIQDATGLPCLVDPRLAPGATADGLREAVSGTDGPTVVVGHQPDCSAIAFALTGADPGFAPAGMAELDLS
jgi:phosphohistidine phosphatase SixA